MIKKFQYKPKMLVAAVTTVILGLDASVAFAQLEEIVVTARKRQESLQDVPVVVQAITSEAIEATGTTTFADLNTQISGLNLTNSGSVSPVIALRGVTSDATNNAADSSVAINLDGVQHSSSQLMRFGLFELASAEVLKGPQALFFGKNSPAGVISLKTNNPTEEFFSEVQLGYEEAAKRKFGHVILSGPVSDNWGARLGVKYTDQEGFFENIWGKGDPAAARPFDEHGPNFDSTLVVGTVRGEFDRGDVAFKLYHAELDGGQYNQRDLFGDCSTTPQPTNPFSTCELDDTFSAAPWTDETGSRFGASRNTSDYELDQFSIEVNYDINDTWDFNNIIGLIDIENFYFGNVGGRNGGDDSVSPFTTGGSLALGNKVDIESVSEEFRFSGDFDTFRFMFGAYFDDREAVNAGNVWIRPDFKVRPDSEVTVDGKSWSIFAQTDIDLTDALELSLGARYSEEERRISGRNFETLGTRIQGNHFFDNSKTEYTDLSPELTLSWRPTEDVTLFASYKEGFKSGGYNASFLDGSSTNRDTGPVPVDTSFSPENVNGAEVGAKMEFLDNNLRVNATAYNYSFTDMQVQVVRLVGGIPEVSTVNAGESTIRGIEVDALWQTPYEPLRVSANLNYNKSEFDVFLQECNQYQLNVSLGACNVDVDNSLLTDAGGLATGTGFDAQDRNGTPLEKSPELSGSFALMYDASITESMRLRANFSASYRDEADIAGVNDPRQYSDAHWILGARLGIYAEDDAWAVDLISRNLTDELQPIDAAYNTNQVDPVTGGQQPSAMVNSPRETVIQFTFRPELLL